MCGITFVTRFDGHSAKKKIRKLYNFQKSRGSDGFGYISLAGKKITSVARHTTEKGIMALLEEEVSSTILFHHRTPTSTPNIVEATHPIVVKNKLLEHDYYVVHNGIITNDDELKEKHEKMGFEYTTECHNSLTTKHVKYDMGMQYNDSEALAIEVSLAIEEKQEKIETKGSIAFIAYQVNKKSGNLVAVFYGRNFSNPLKMKRTEELFFLASEGEGEAITVETLYRFDFTTKEITEKHMTIGLFNYTPYHYPGMGYGHGEDFRDRDDTEAWKLNLEEQRTRLPAPKSSTIEQAEDVILTLEEEMETLEIEQETLNQQTLQTEESLLRIGEIQYRLYIIEHEIEEYEMLKYNV